MNINQNNKMIRTGEAMPQYPQNAQNNNQFPLMRLPSTLVKYCASQFLDARETANLAMVNKKLNEYAVDVILNLIWRARLITKEDLIANYFYLPKKMPNLKGLFELENNFAKKVLFAVHLNTSVVKTKSMSNVDLSELEENSPESELNKTFDQTALLCTDLEYYESRLGQEPEEVPETAIYLQKLLQTCQKLKVIKAQVKGYEGEHNERNDDKACATVFNHGANLEEILYDLWGEIDDDILEKAAKNWQNLRILEVSNGPNISDEGLKILARNCPNLQYFSDTRGDITDDGLEIFIAGCKNLTRLDLPYLSSDSTLEKISKNCHNIRHLDLCYRKNISDKGVQSIVKWPFLQYIELQGTYITDQSLFMIGDHCKNLEKIDLQNTAISNDGVYYLAVHCPKLKTIELATSQNYKRVISSAKWCSNTWIHYNTKVTSEIKEMIDNKLLGRKINIIGAVCFTTSLKHIERLKEIRRFSHNIKYLEGDDHSKSLKLSQMIFNDLWILINLLESENFNNLEDLNKEKLQETKQLIKDLHKRGGNGADVEKLMILLGGIPKVSEQVD